MVLGVRRSEHSAPLRVVNPLPGSNVDRAHDALPQTVAVFTTVRSRTSPRSVDGPNGRPFRAGVTYYICGGRLATGPSVCSATSVPTAYLDTAVLDGIVKRAYRILEPGEIRRRLASLMAQETQSPAAIPDLTARLAEIERRIARLVEALAAGPDDLLSVRAALVALERERARLSRDLADARARSGPRPATETAVEAMLAALERLPEILATRRTGSGWCGRSWPRWSCQGAGGAPLVPPAASRSSCGHDGGGGRCRT